MRGSVWRALLGDVIEIGPLVGLLEIHGGGITPVLIASEQATASIALAAPMVWPIMDLIGAHRHVRRAVAKQCAYGDRLHAIVGGRTGAVGADVIDFVRAASAFFERHGHGPDGAVALRMRGRHVMEIATHAIAEHFGVDRGASRD